MAKLTVPNCRQIVEFASKWNNAMMFVDRGSKLLAADFGPPVIYETATGKRLGQFTDPRVPNSGVCWTMAQVPKHVVCGIFATVCVWDADGKTPQRQFESPLGIVSSIAISKDRRWLVYGTWQKMLVCVNFTTGAIRWQHTGKTSFSGKVEITTDGRQVIIGGNDKIIRLWDLASGVELKTIGTHDGWIQGLAVHPDGKRLLSGGRDKVVCVWDIASGKKLATLEGHKKEIRQLRITPDGQFAVSAGGDGAKVWDIENEKLVATFLDHGKSISSLAIAPEARVVATCGEDSKIRIWELP